MFETILVVCHGNICRSPAAAAMLQQRLPKMRVDSAGLHALVGHPAETTVLELASADGLDLSRHAAKQLRGEMLQRSDLILVMSESQRLSIIEKVPATAGKVMLFGKWLLNPETGQPGQEIPDPYQKSKEAFMHVHQLLSQAADHWQRRLQ